VVRESLIRGGVLSTSYELQGAHAGQQRRQLLVLVDLALPAQSMPDEYLLEIERWIQQSAKARHTMEVRAVYWRRKAVARPGGIALKAAMTGPDPARQPATPRSPPHGHPGPDRDAPGEKVGGRTKWWPSARRWRRRCHPPTGTACSEPPMPESVSDFSALSETQYGKL
jgi:hypothetical protein